MYTTKTKVVQLWWYKGQTAVRHPENYFYLEALHQRQVDLPFLYLTITT